MRRGGKGGFSVRWLASAAPPRQPPLCAQLTTSPPPSAAPRSARAGKSTLLQAVAREVTARMAGKLPKEGEGGEAADAAAGKGGSDQKAPRSLSSGSSGGRAASSGGGGGGSRETKVAPRALLCEELPAVVSPSLKVGLADAAELVAQVRARTSACEYRLCVFAGAQGTAASE